MTMDSSRILQGKPNELGSTVFPDGVNFALYSKSATQVILSLFEDSKSTKPYASIPLNPLKNKTGDIWHVFVKDLKPGALYLYQIAGPYNPPEGQRFNINKYIVDPCAKSFSQGSLFRSYNKQRLDGRAGIENGQLQDLSDFQKCVVIDDADFDWQGDAPLCRPMSETIIYELHVRGFTKSFTSGVQHPGTYKGIIEKIPYLKFLGITAVELLPVFEFDENETEFVNPRTGKTLTNYWGYSPASFFAPETSYALEKNPTSVVREFKEMVRELHKAGIEVILDVVFNHTAEGNEYGKTFLYRGIENSVYYILSSGGKQYYDNYSGCGNTVNANHPVVMQHILQSLRHWVLDMHVDGFRFDLASALCRGADGSILGEPPLPLAISEDPILANTKIIAEPWDCAGAYHLGHFPGARWAEWNGRFRDDIRRFIRGDEKVSTEAATRMSGSSDLFKDSKGSPLHSINFITCHDGFTLNDLVSYNYKHNEENGEENRDGSDDNLSYNNGYEGASENPKIVGLRKQRVKNFLSCLFLSQGTPMLLSGDEMLHTQNGNNNAYCQDNETSWINWHDCDRNADILRFTRLLIQFRKNHPAFRRVDYFHDSSEITWFDRNGKNPDWNSLSRFLAFKMNGNASGISDSEFYIAVNTENYDLTITLPTIQKKWYRVIDTSLASPNDILEEGCEEFLEEQKRYVLLSNSFILLMTK